MKVLVMNAGSSSLKYQLLEMTEKSVLAKGLCERVGTKESFHTYGVAGENHHFNVPMKNHHDAVKAVLDALIDPEVGILSSLDEIGAVGHRVVHGGEHFTSSVLIDEDVIEKIQFCSKLAPLHNPGALMGIEACRTLMSDKPQVAVFDTAFHHSIPPRSYMYALPYELYEQHHIRRYGFHGTSHRYVAQQTAAFLDRPLEDLKLITCHLGNGCSITAIDHGRSVDTSMGFTPLEGLMMGTRCGSIDPAIPLHLIEDLSMTPQEVNDILNKRSGLLGISGLSNDVRDVASAAREGNERAVLALEMYATSVKRYIGAYLFALAGADAIVLTAGIGENSELILRMIFEGLEYVGIILDQKRISHHAGERLVSDDRSIVKVLVIPTNEELMIAHDTVALANS